MQMSMQYPAKSHINMPNRYYDWPKANTKPRDKTSAQIYRFGLQTNYTSQQVAQSRVMGRIEDALHRSFMCSFASHQYNSI